MVLLQSCHLRRLSSTMLAKCAMAQLRLSCELQYPCQPRAFGMNSFPAMIPQHKSKLQVFFDLAKTQLHGTTVPSAEVVMELTRTMLDIPLQELGFEATAAKEPWLPLSRHSHLFPKKVDEGITCRLRFQTVRRITYLHIYEDDNLTLGIFCFPPGALIPLHDHPKMTVFSRVLFGQLQVASYDWCDSTSRTARRGQAKLVLEKQVTAPAPPMVLYPNLGRDCTYYRVAETGESGLHEVLLEEHEPPADFQVVRGDYRGLAVRA